MTGTDGIKPVAKRKNVVLPSLKTNSSHLKNASWKTSFLLGWPILRGYVSFREGTHPKTNMAVENPAFEYVFPVGNWDFPASQASFRGGE